MATLNQVPSETAEAAIRALCEARDAARCQTHLFSAQTWRSWRELEHEIDVKLEDVEHRLAQNGLQAAEVAFARADELRRAVDALLRDNSQRAAHSIMTTRVKTCSPDDTLDRVARLLWEGDCGALPVVDERGKVVGMITDRDLCMASYTRNASLSACSVHSTMSKGVITCSPDDSIQRLAEIMAHEQVRRIPVVAPDGTLLGIVTLADLAHYLGSLPDEHPSRALMLRTLAAISERRTR
jgi:CBS domain-containing protein